MSVSEVSECGGGAYCSCSWGTIAKVIYLTRSLDRKFVKFVVSRCVWGVY